MEAEYTRMKTSLGNDLRWAKKIHRFIEYISSHKEMAKIHVLIDITQYIENELKYNTTLNDRDKQELTSVVIFLKECPRNEQIFKSLAYIGLDVPKTLMDAINLALDE